MTSETVVHQSDVELQGDRYTITVLMRGDGRYVATTRFADDDIIINDGMTIEDVLSRHERLLPLAVSSRKMFRS